MTHVGFAGFGIQRHQIRGAGQWNRRRDCKSARIHNDEGVPPLIETLKDADPDVRRSALKALSAFPVKNAQRALVDAVADKDPSVSYMAHRLLRESTGRSDVAQTKEDWAQVVK